MPIIEIGWALKIDEGDHVLQDGRMTDNDQVMRRRRFGRTELDMPVLSCGGMRYQQSWKDLKPDELEQAAQENVEACIRRALELGLNHIETARGYGSSEWQLGRILPRLPRDEMIVQTKIGPKDSAEEFMAVFETSMDNLQLDYLDLLGVHGINTHEILDTTLKPDGMWSAVRSLQRSGRVGHVGFSTHGPPDVISRALDTGEFDYVNLHWYYINPFTWPAIEAATRADAGVFIISPNDKGGRLYEPSDKIKQLCAPLTPMQFNDLYCLSRPEVHTLSIGATRPADFDEHVDALAHWDNQSVLTEQIDQRLQGALVERHGEAWAKHWHDGLPDWESVPGGVNVFEILRLWTYGTAWDLIAWAKMRYNLLGQGGHWFPGNNAADVDDAGWDELLAGSRFRGEIPGILREAHALLVEAPVERASQGG